MSLVICVIGKLFCHGGIVSLGGQDSDGFLVCFLLTIRTRGLMIGSYSAYQTELSKIVAYIDEIKIRLAIHFTDVSCLQGFGDHACSFNHKKSRHMHICLFNLSKRAVKRFVHSSVDVFSEWATLDPAMESSSLRSKSSQRWASTFLGNLNLPTQTSAGTCHWGHLKWQHVHQFHLSH